MTPLVDVNIAVYNHAHFLRQTLNSVLSQKTEFGIRILIGDDFSTDGSREILKEYEEKFPDKVKVIYQTHNLGFTSSETNGQIVLKSSTAKYIAFLDGDDYWTDPLKLQKQVDFLEQNPDYVLCAANATVQNLTDQPFREMYCHFDSDRSFNQAQVLTDFYCPTLSMVFRKSALVFPDWFHSVKSGDSFLHYLLSKHGKFYFMNFIAGVYRQHSGGISNLNNRLHWHENTITYLRRLKGYVEPQNEIVLSEIIYKEQLDYVSALKAVKEYGKAAAYSKQLEPIPFAVKRKFIKSRVLNLRGRLIANIKGIIGSSSGT